jgi:hypothetical protein
MPGLKWATYSFTPDIPPMTPWGKQRYLAVKPSYGPRSFADSTDYVNPTTGKDVGCLPPGVPRIYIQPFALEMVQTPGRVLEYFEFDHHIRQIFTDGRQPRSLHKQIKPVRMASHGRKNKQSAFSF